VDDPEQQSVIAHRRGAPQAQAIEAGAVTLIINPQQTTAAALGTSAGRKEMAPRIGGRNLGGHGRLAGICSDLNTVIAPDPLNPVQSQNLP
jgi:hypothetical protein